MLATSSTTLKHLTSLLLAALVIAPIAATAQHSGRDVVVRVSPARPIRTFDPKTTLGAAIDGHDHGELDRRLTPEYISQMLATGLGPLSYRLRTELGGEAWHWSPQGSFSDLANEQGYWTSSTDPPVGGISLSYGYRLPRRGNTVDQANNDGYSRIDDDDETSFWKSNPYLDTAFTHENNSLHPQWIVVDLERQVAVNAIQILWGDQFAAAFDVEYSSDKLTADFGLRPTTGWRSFPNGGIRQRRPDESVHRLSTRPVTARYLRIGMRAASHNGPRSNDIRDNVGYSIRELRIGAIPGTTFHDEVVHGKAANLQSTIFVSSTDPWHRSTDIDSNQEHIGFDRLLATGLTNGQPMMVPVGLLYDTPQNAANEIAYLVKRGIKFDGIELGEEPDGQNVAPLDYAALYIQFADAIHRVAPDAKLGGPSFQDIVSNLDERKEGAGNGRWLKTFVDYLGRRGHKRDFNFLSFEWYPYDDVCLPTGPQVRGSSELLARAIRAMRADGLDPRIPLVISEYGYSPFATAAEDDLEGAIVNFDGVATMLSMGGEAAFLYGYEPDHVEREYPCTAGNNMLFLMMPDASLRETATFYGAELMLNDWLQPGGGSHRLLATTSSSSAVGAYAVRRPDGRLGVVLLNREPDHSARVRVELGPRSPVPYPFDQIQFSHDQYQWDPKLGQPAKSDPPARTTTDISRPIDLPPYSITVLREK